MCVRVCESVCVTELDIELDPRDPNGFWFSALADSYKCFDFFTVYFTSYGVATMSRMLKNTGLFAEYRSLL